MVMAPRFLAWVAGWVVFWEKSWVRTGDDEVSLGKVELELPDGYLERVLEAVPEACANVMSI